MHKIKFERSEFYPVYVEDNGRFYDGYATLTDKELAFVRTAMENFDEAQKLIESKFEDKSV